MSKITKYRNVRKHRFTQINNDLLSDKDVTLQAKGLLSIFLSNSDEWDLNMKEIINRSKNGRDAHYKVVSELIKHGYFARIEVQGSDYCFERMEYIFSDSKEDVEVELIEIEKWAKENKKIIFVEYRDRIDKQKKPKKERTKKIPHTENQDAEKIKKIPHTENQDADKQYPENQYINNTNNNNNNINNTNNKEEEKKNNIVFEVLAEYLRGRKIPEETILKIIDECKTRNIEIFSLEDAEKQYQYMMQKINAGTKIYNFAQYYVNGLSSLIEQSETKMQFIEERKVEKEKKRDNIYFDWINAK